MALEFYGSAIAGLSAGVKKELVSKYSTEKHVSASGRHPYFTLQSLWADNPEDDVLLAILLLCVHEVRNLASKKKNPIDRNSRHKLFWRQSDDSPSQRGCRHTAAAVVLCSTES